MPRPKDVRDPQPTPVLLSSLTIDEREYFSSLLEDYKRLLKKYDRQVEALSDLRSKIQETVYADNLRYTMRCDHEHDIMLNLKARFAPTDKERQQELIAEWKSLCKKPEKGQDISVWLDKWENTYDDCKELDLPDVTNTRPHYDLLNAVQHLNPTWSDLYRCKITDEENIDFKDLLRSLRNYRRTAKTAQGSTAQHGAFPSFQNQDRDENTNGNNNNNDGGNKPPPKCFCGRRHFYRECYYVIEALRHPRWKPNKEVQEAFEKRLKEDSRFQNNIANARKTY